MSGTIARINSDTYCYRWFIRNLHIFRHDPKSSTFTTGVDNENKWYLSLIDCSGLCITLLDCKEEIVNVKVKVYSPTENNAVEYEQNKLSLQKGKSNFLHGFAELCYAVVADDYSHLPPDGVTIICEITHLKPQTTFEDHSLLNDLKLTLQSGKNSDVTIFLEQKEFRVHKFMLALRSPVFSAMFKHNMKESKQNIIEITDIDQDIMEIILEYIYTGTLKDIDDEADRLFIAADKYALEGLRIMCSKVLIEKISIENVFQMFELADQYQANDLKECVLDYISNHREEVMKMPEYKLISNMPFFSIRQIVTRFSDNCMVY